MAMVICGSHRICLVVFLFFLVFIDSSNMWASRTMLNALLTNDKRVGSPTLLWPNYRQTFALFNSNLSKNLFLLLGLTLDSQSSVLVLNLGA